jgi:sigma-B regulation protein RsbU (phosphoserine phosphatase)
MLEISVQSADGSRRRVPLTKDQVSIGRSRESDIFLPDQWLSRHHAEIRLRQEGVFIRDLGSKNGTLLNGNRVSGEQRLQPGDVLTLGEHLLTLGIEEELDDEAALHGTRMFPARELSDVSTKPLDPDGLARQNRVLGVLSRAASALIVHRPVGELFELILDLVLEALPAERAAILLLEGAGPELAIKASRSRSGETIARVSRSIARRVVEQQVSILIPNVLDDALLRSQESIMASGIRAAVCAPLWLSSAAFRSEKDTVIGLLYLDTSGQEAFNEDDLRVLTALANVAAAKIENERLLEENIRSRRLEDDMRLASEIQRGLLPNSVPELPGWRFSGSNEPCRTVGGDYYDFVVDADRVVFALGDVAGKGMGAALLMSVLRASVRAHWTHASLAEAMARINRTICENTPENKFVTFFMGRLDPATGGLAYVNAGHNAPLLVHADGTIEPLQEGGIVLGMFDNLCYAEGTARLLPGDALVAYSDGLPETWSAEDEEFGEERLADVVLRHRALDAAAIEAALHREIEAFAGGAKATDDRTVIVIKRL